MHEDQQEETDKKDGNRDNLNLENQQEEKYDIDLSRKTALHIACRNDYSNMIEVLVDFNSSLDLKDD
jgi:ankyrin repeat protein